MNFYRLFHGLPYDARLAVIAKRAGMSRAEALAMHVALHDHASQAVQRGSLFGFDAELVALGLEIEVVKVTAALAAFEDKGVIREGHLAEWARQLSPSTERVRRHRARKRASGQLLPKRPLPPLDPDDPREAALRRQRLQQTRQKH